MTDNIVEVKLLENKRLQKAGFQEKQGKIWVLTSRGKSSPSTWILVAISRSQFWCLGILVPDTSC